VRRIACGTVIDLLLNSSFSNSRELENEELFMFVLCKSCVRKIKNRAFCPVNFLKFSIPTQTREIQSQKMVLDLFHTEKDLLWPIVRPSKNVRRRTLLLL